MTNISLTLHFYGPTWAWWIVAIAATLIALGSITRTGLRIWEWDAKRRAVNNLIAQGMANISKGKGA